MKGITVTKEFINFDEYEAKELDTRPMLVKTDQKRLQQVLLNLFSNAIKFTDRNGTIEIQTELKSGFLGGESKLYIEVKDNGLGVKEEDQSKLFKQFSSFKDPSRNINTRGIGLGLVICKMLVEQFQGTINFKSKYKEGSVFFYTFETWSYNERELAEMRNQNENMGMLHVSSDSIDLHQSQNANLSMIDQFMKMKEVQHNRILVVDDEEFCISTMEYLLKLAGLDVAT